MPGGYHRLVTLNVHVHVVRAAGHQGAAHDLEHAIGSRTMLDRGHWRRDVVQAADHENLFRVGGDDQRVKARGSARPVVDPGEHGTAAERSQQLARQPGGFEVRRDHAQYFAHLLHEGYAVVFFFGKAVVSGCHSKMRSSYSSKVESSCSKPAN